MSFEQFKKNMYLLNAFSLNMLQFPNLVKFQELNIDDVKQTLSQMRFTSAIGHESTAQVLSQRLGMKIDYNRVDVSLKPGDEAIIAQLPRPKEGQIYSAIEIQEMPIRFIYVYVRN